MHTCIAQVNAHTMCIPTALKTLKWMLLLISRKPKLQLWLLHVELSSPSSYQKLAHFYLCTGYGHSNGEGQECIQIELPTVIALSQMHKVVYSIVCLHSANILSIAASRYC